MTNNAFFCSIFSISFTFTFNYEYSPTGQQNNNRFVFRWHVAYCEITIQLSFVCTKITFHFMFTCHCSLNGLSRRGYRCPLAVNRAALLKLYAFLYVYDPAITSSLPQWMLGSLLSMFGVLHRLDLRVITPQRAFLSFVCEKN